MSTSSKRSLGRLRRGTRVAEPANALETQAAPATTQAPVEIAPNDPLLAYLQSAGGAVDVDALELDSDAVRDLKAAGVKLAVPLVSQGELIGVLNLGARLSEQEYSSDDRRLLDNLAGAVGVSAGASTMILSPTTRAAVYGTVSAPNVLLHAEGISTVGQTAVSIATAGLVAGGRMHHEAGGLVDHDDVVVLEHDIERNILALGLRCDGFGDIDNDRIPGRDMISGVADGGALCGHRTGEDQRLQPRARQFRAQHREHAVEPGRSLVAADSDLKPLPTIRRRAVFQRRAFA